MELTPEQQTAVDHPAQSPLVLLGGPGTGKTAALLERHARLLSAYPASRVLVLCRNRSAAERVAATVLPRLRGGFDSLPVTTVPALAYDFVARSVGPPRLLTAAARRVLIGRLLAADDPARWPLLGRFLGRAGFVEEVAAALEAASEAGLEVAEAAGAAWSELAGFARRYRSALEEAGQVDLPGLLAAATAVAPSHVTRFDHVIVDDAHALAPSAARLLAALAGGRNMTVTLALDPEAGPALAAAALVDAAAAAGAHQVRLTRPFRAPSPGRLIRCDHPSTEPEAIAAELLRQRREGVPWAAMAVIVPRLGRRARSVGRALARHGIPVVPVPGLATDEPLVQVMVDLLRWVDGDARALERLLGSPLAQLDPLEARRVRRDALAGGFPLASHPRLAHLVALRDRLVGRLESGDSPADLAYEAWAAALARQEEPGASATGHKELGAVDDRALDGLVSLVDALAAAGEDTSGITLAGALAAIDAGAHGPDPWRTSRSAGPEGVTITSIAGAEGGEWHTTVVAGCVEGELPRLSGGSALFDPAAIGAEGPSLSRERRRFSVATTRATTSLVATAAPAPGVLLSRFVEAWPPERAALAEAPGQAAPMRAESAGAVPVVPDRRLVLSASQLDIYDDCPLRYAYHYVLRARQEPGVHASLGTLVHEVLADFCNPERPEPVDWSLEGLLDVAAKHWRDDVARYRPQVEEVRRDLVAMLTAWWEQEGSREGMAAGVLAVERKFDIQVGPHRLQGSIDRVDRAPDGRLAVIDYKTGKQEPRPDEVVDDLQLAVYHLAATRDERLAAVGTPGPLRLRYLRSMNVFEQPVTEGHAGRTEARVLAVADRILAEEFEPSVDANCRTCDFHRLCPLQPEGRQT